MTAQSSTLNTDYFNRRPFSGHGFILDFKEAARALPADTGRDYIPALDWRVKNGNMYSGAERQELLTRRRSDAETKIIATFDPKDTSNLPDITACAFNVKKAGDMYIAVPDALETVLPKIHTAAMDALQLYGAELFAKTNMSFIVQRNTIETGEAARPHFAHWHNHITNHESIDMAYLFHDILGTENKLTHHNGASIKTTEVIAPDHVMTRFGGEIMHRSQPNENKTSRREWGALTINIEPARGGRSQNHRSENDAQVSENSAFFDAFKKAANHVIGQDQSVHRLEHPQTLIEFTNTHIEHN